jgi:photosystem II stability/assembly factor-like uncharacterized protein
LVITSISSVCSHGSVTPPKHPGPAERNPNRAVAAPVAKPAPRWQPVSTGSTSHFRALSVVSAKVVLLGGYDGTVLRTVDGGRTWQDVSPAGASTLQFRDIEASSAQHAVAMAAGATTDSRLYETSNGGRTWQLAYTNHNAAAFFDCMSFFDAQHGLVMSDPVQGKFRILSTRDGGRSWRVLPSAGCPLPRPVSTGSPPAASA